MLRSFTRKLLNPQTTQPFRSVRPNKAFYSKCSKSSIVFDIDGVLVKGEHTLEEGKKALKYLNGENPFNVKVPHVFMTNSGGVSEASKALDLSTRLNTQVSPNQIILSHSPMRRLATTLADQTVLVVGGVQNNCAEIAASYGFKNVITPQDIHAFDPYKIEAINQLKVSAVLMFHDTFKFGRDLQITLDVLRCKDGKIHSEFCNAGKQSVPVWVSNQDFHFSNETVNPRFAQGAFHECLKALYKMSTGNELKYTAFGKPNRVQYDYTESVLKNWINENSDDFGHNGQHMLNKYDTFAIGDNPLSDIAGANSYGWSSILVCTGVYSKNTDKPLQHKPSYIADNVYEAVKIIVENNPE
ncbi:hypothetical protein BB561_004118 [Smittium simulii]|uniref:TIGR01456 family HAD hydrolase n=1 Tax=Smittium simulii TaxID=133385 RepID=A0A2T9YI00_9FUNG|nr:hypothetical protein BB561_004118 [Smittium simulii]